MKPARNRPRLAAAITAGALVALAVPTAVVPAFAVISDPGTHIITVFPERDMVSAEGYAAGDHPTIQVLRGGAVIGTSSVLTPAAGIVEVNHPGGGCWEGTTPDIRPGDVVRVLTAPDVGDQTSVGNVTVTQPATKINASTVVMKGTAVATGGGQLPADQLEARVVAANQSFALNGRRTLRAGAPGSGADGVVVYDGPGVTTWTATWTGLTGVGADGVSDADRASSTTTSESRGMWLGRAAAIGNEVTIFEYAAIGGPAAPCTAPLAKGPSTPDLTAATDTGRFNTDNITRSTTPGFTGAVALPDAASVNLYIDGVASGSASVAANGSYSITSNRALANGRHTVTAGEVSPAGIETRSAASLAVTVDTVAPSVTAKAPAVNSLMVSQTANVTATFSEPMAGIGFASFNLKNSAGAVIAAPVTWNATTRVATANPNVTLTADRKHTVTLTSGITDIAGNPIAANSWAFTTGPRPVVTAKSPATNATAVSRTANVTATISENVTGVSNGTFALRNAATGALVSYAVSYNATSHVATLNPNVTLAANTKYTATISTSIKDGGGNPLSGLSWSFTTGR
ncbi:Ig-like domain-containing protein [Arthrobacter sp. ISL-65]|uniref:Ig-like domain-containing protein n=1 Tax=Arthrobacter sp. ISL-65 TaxID=2819112 RepID=UPI001BEC0288|nr:Ig-like domain-containing protein [Arthrobacter sp. ISL-65]MBT2547003.1 Ig-like domain-containing protein [Arthrobacter sp. ISL-65]